MQQQPAMFLLPNAGGYAFLFVDFILSSGNLCMVWDMTLNEIIEKSIFWLSTAAGTMIKGIERKNVHSIIVSIKVKIRSNFSFTAYCRSVLRTLFFFVKSSIIDDWQGSKYAFAL